MEIGCIYPFCVLASIFPLVTRFSPPSTDQTSFRQLLRENIGRKLGIERKGD